MRTLFQFLALWGILVLFAWSFMTVVGWAIERIRARDQRKGEDDAQLRLPKQ